MAPAIPVIDGEADVASNAYAFDQTMTVPVEGSSDTAEVVARVRSVDGSAYARFAVDEALTGGQPTVFGDRCWMDLNAVFGEMDEADLPEQFAGVDFSAGFPGALTVFQRFRPGDTALSGTTSGQLALSGIGYNKLTQTPGAEFGRMPMEVELDDTGRFASAFLPIAGVAEGIRASDASDYRIRRFADELERTAITGWRISVEPRASVDVVAPPQQDLLDEFGETCA